MASKLLQKSNKFNAQLVTEDRKPCVFCEREVDDELVYGKLYAIGNIQCHYFCVLLSCCLVQKGRDTQGLFGFMYRDILAEVERSKKHKCSYCGKGGATLGCSVSQCRKQFHLPCGRNKNAVSMFYGTYKTFCQLHVPKQQLSADVASKVKLRKQASKALKLNNEDSDLNESLESAFVCAICYEAVDAFPTTDTFWPPCCARDAWFHRVCVQRMALSAGKHYFKCPLCNDKEHFFDAIMKQGYYVPDRDAAWELEQNAFAEIYERPLVCSAEECKCPMGREHDAEMDTWDVKLCLLCGSTGVHSGCMESVETIVRFVCQVCRDIARDDADRLASCVEAALLEEQERNRCTRSGPIMPSRMSLRRTKQRIAFDPIPSSSSNAPNIINSNKNTAASRETLNLKPIRNPKILSPMLLRNVEVTLLSPIKHLENALNEKLSTRGMKDIVVDSNSVVDQIRKRFMKPKPRSAKRKIVDEIAEGLFNNILTEFTKTKDPVIEWTSPKKTTDSQKSQENQRNTPSKLPKSTPSPLKARNTKLNTKETKTRKSPRNEKCSEISNIADCDSLITREKKSSESTDIKKEDKTESDTIKLETNDKNEQKTRNENEQESQKTPKHEKEDELSTTPISKDILVNNREKTPSPDKIETDSFKTANNNETEEIVTNIDEESSSTFELPKEFIADTISDDEFPITPSKLKTVDIQKDSSMEISENDEIVTVDLTQMESNDDATAKRKKIKFKFGAVNKSLDKSELDMETFKNQYLNEVNNFNCKFKHNHKPKLETPKIQTVIDFAIDAALKHPPNLKRKLDMSEDLEEKKIKLIEEQGRDERINKKQRKRQKRKLKKKMDKMGMRLSFRAKNIQLKIRIRDEKLKVKIKKKQKSIPNTMKQCVLSTKKDSPTFVKPEKDVVLKKRNYVKSEKSPDNWKQTSLSSFFVKKE